MTAQLPDRVRLDGRDYVLISVTGGPVFDPASCGLVPMMMHTACWRGYVCTYAVVEGRLVLAELEVGGASLVCGRPVDATTTLLGTPAQTDAYGSSMHFRELAVPIPLTGRMLLGDRFIREHYVHMGFQAAWAYEDVVELVLDGGVVTDRQDRSEELAAVRRSHADQR